MSRLKLMGIQYISLMQPVCLLISESMRIRFILVLAHLMVSLNKPSISSGSRIRPSILTYTHQVKIDSVVSYNRNRYHWYIAINPTKYKVAKRSFNEDGLEVENVYYDNIMHVSVFLGANKLFSSDFHKQQYKGLVPDAFLDEAILANMEYSHIDAQGLHFNATLCIPDGATCYMVESTISYTGVSSMKLVEY